MKREVAVPRFFRAIFQMIFGAALLVVLSDVTPSSACTIFKSPRADENRIAHNVDWYERFSDIKGLLSVNAAHLRKTGELLGAPIAKAEWISKWRSLTFSIAGAEFPVSGFNEKGLTMGVLELPRTQYPDVSDARPGVGVSQFVQYNLDMSETIDDVIASDQVIRPFSSLARMHYFACDRSSKCVVLQYIGGKLQVFRDSALPFSALTNSYYPESAAAAQTCQQQEPGQGTCAEADNSLWRFSKAVVLSQGIDASRPYEPQAFSILDQVVQSEGAVTRFQMVYDPGARAIQIRKRGSTQVARLVADFEAADCRQPRMGIFIDANSQGDLSNSWVPLTADLQTDMVKRIGYPQAAADIYGHYPFQSTHCEN